MIINFQIFEKNFIKKNIPNWFYLVLKPDNKALESLMQMEFIQLKGISDHYKISKGWFDIRDILIIMKGSEVIKLNDIEPIQYFNADNLCKDNFKFWRRLVMSNPHFLNNTDISFSNAIDKILHDLYYSHVRHRKDNSLSMRVTYDKNGLIKYIQKQEHEISDKINHLYHANQLNINTFNDFTMLILKILKNLAKNTLVKDYPWETHWTEKEDYIMNKLEFNELRKILNRSFDYISKVYEDEGEWYVNGKSFKIPKNSILYFKKQGGKISKTYGSSGLDPEVIEKYIKEYGLDHIYQIKTVDNHEEMMDILKNEYSNDN